MNARKNTRIGSTQTIGDAIKKIALHGVVSSSGAVTGTARTSGYVAKVHTSEDDDLIGTVDVQEYIANSISNSSGAQGYHEGVYLSALQNNDSGLVIVPKQYSEVVIAADPATKREYVVMVSHVDVIQLESHEEVSIGVTETEEFDVTDEDGPDVDELEATGNATHTSYTKSSAITSSVSTDTGSSETITPSSITLTHEDSSVTLDDSKVELKQSDETVTVQGDGVYVGSTSSTEHAVLGESLADILMEMLEYISQITTSTMLGTQPPINVASFISLRAKISAYKSATTNFLTDKVNIQS